MQNHSRRTGSVSALQCFGIVLFVVSLTGFALGFIEKRKEIYKTNNGEISASVDLDNRETKLRLERLELKMSLMEKDLKDKTKD